MEATTRQRQLISTLCRELEIEAPTKLLSKEEADAYIKRLIAVANNGTLKPEIQEDLRQDKYSIAFQSFVKSACELYKGTSRTFEQVFNEVKKLF